MDTAQKPLRSGFGRQTTAEEIISVIDLRGKVAIVTGGHGGLGLETTRALSKAGATVIIGARDLKKAESAASNLKGVEVEELDLSSPESIDQFSEWWRLPYSRRTIHRFSHLSGAVEKARKTTGSGWHQILLKNPCCKTFR